MYNGVHTVWLIGLILVPLVLASLLHGFGHRRLAHLVVIVAIALWIRLLWPTVTP